MNEQNHKCEHMLGVQLSDGGWFCFDCHHRCSGVREKAEGDTVEDALVRELAMMDGLVRDLSRFSSRATELLESAHMAVRSLERIREAVGSDAWLANDLSGFDDALQTLRQHDQYE